MKLVFLIPSLGRGKGGSERVASELGFAMHDRGHKVGYVYKSPQALKEFPYPLPAGAPLLRYDNSWASQACLRDKIAALAPDLILIFYSGYEISQYMELVAGLDIPIAVQECSNPERVTTTNWLNAPNAVKMREDILKKAAGIRLTHDFYKDSIPDSLKDRVHAFSNAFRRSVTFPTHKRKKTILHIGCAKENKNVTALLDAFAILSPEFPDWQLELCTMIPRVKSRFYEKLKERISDDILHGRIILHENVNDMDSLYQGASIHCITSLSEGSPNCICEAMCQGTPSVGFADARGVNLRIGHEKNGLLAAAGPEALAGQLRRLMLDEELSGRLGRQAWMDAAQFEPEKIWDEWEKFFKDSLERAKSENHIFAAENEVWNPEMGDNWLERLKHGAARLSGEALFYGAGSIYEQLKDRFSHLKPVAMLLDAVPDNSHEIDGIPVMQPGDASEEQKRLPVVIFGRYAPVMSHKLKSTYGFRGEILCADANALEDGFNRRKIYWMPPVKVEKRLEVQRKGKFGYAIAKADSAEGICDEIPACAWCGSTKMAPYLSSDVPHWFTGAKFRLVRCENCGLVFNSPRPNEEAAIRDFNLTAEANFLRKLNRPNVQQIHDNAAKKILAFKPDAHDVFDVGCGAGTLMIAFRKLGLTAQGNEVNAFACNALMEQGFTVYNEPTWRLPLENCCDIVTMMDYLEHTYAPFDDLLKAWIMLRPGGILHLKTLYLGSPDHVALGEKWQLFGKGHNYYFLPDVIERMVENAGFEILDKVKEQLIHITAKKAFH